MEAKYYRFSLFSNDSKLKKRIINNVKLAVDDTKNSKEETSIMMGIAFLVPYIPPIVQDNEEKMLTDFIRLLKGMKKNLLAVYINPHVMKDEDGYSYPCIAILGDVVS